MLARNSPKSTSASSPGGVILDDYHLRPRPGDLGPQPGHEVAHCGLGHHRSLLLHQPLPDAAGGVPLLARRVQVLGQPPPYELHVDTGDGRLALRDLPDRWHGVSQRRADRAPVHVMVAGELCDRQALITPVPSDTFELLYSRSAFTLHLTNLVFGWTSRTVEGSRGAGVGSLQPTWNPGQHYASERGHFRLANSSPKPGPQPGLDRGEVPPDDHADDPPGGQVGELTIHGSMPLPGAVVISERPDGAEPVLIDARGVLRGTGGRPARTGRCSAVASPWARTDLARQRP
jgi:hypothetical protein